MPKTFSLHERETIKTAMHNTVLDLLKRKSIRQITVDDIAMGANIAKGSFYSFYKTREEFLWEVFKADEQAMYNKVVQILSDDMIDRWATAKKLFEAYLSMSAVLFYISDADYEYIVRKLPPEKLQESRVAGENVYAMVLTHFGHESDIFSIEVFAHLLATVQMSLRSDISSSDEVRKRAVELFTDFIADYLVKGSCKGDSYE